VSTPQLIIVCVTVLLLAVVIAAVVSASRSAHLPHRQAGGVGVSPWGDIGTTLVVHTLDGRSLRGTLRAFGQYVELEDAAYLLDGAEHPVGGTVHVPESNVGWAQALPTPGLKAVG
jgi:hypothetical protein